MTEKKLHKHTRLICLLMILTLLIPLAMPAGAASAKNTFGIITDAQKRTLVGVAVKNGSDVLVYTASADQIKTGTKGTFSIDGKTKVAVKLEANEVGGSIQRWKATEKTNLANSLYSTAKPVAQKDAAALYLASDSSGKLVRRQTAVTLSGIVKETAIAIHLKGQKNRYLEDKAFSLGLLLDAGGNAVGILCGTDAAICSWYSTSKASTASGAIQEGDSQLVSSGVRSVIETSSVINPNLLKVSMLYNELIQQLAEKKPGMDYCAATTTIAYRDSGLRTLKNGKRIADGYGKSFSGSFSKGGGACIDDDSYWYMSFTFPLSTVDDDTFNYNSIAMIWAAVMADVGTDPGKDASESLNKAQEILKKLFEDKESTAVTAGKLVFFRVSDGKQVILGVDSDNFFKNYPTTIENFKKVS